MILYLQEGHGGEEQERRGVPLLRRVLPVEHEPGEHGGRRQVHLRHDLQAAGIEGAEGLNVT